MDGSVTIPLQRDMQNLAAAKDRVKNVFSLTLLDVSNSSLGVLTACVNLLASI